jgi:hypothetical protein
MSEFLSVNFKLEFSAIFLDQLAHHNFLLYSTQSHLFSSLFTNVVNGESYAARGENVKLERR